MLKDAAAREYIHRLSHDLQEPLSKIITISELLVEKAKGLDETERDYLRRMHEAGKRMKAMLDELTREYADRPQT